MLKILGSTVALAMFALPLVPQITLSQQATSQSGSILNPTPNDSTPVTGTTPVTGNNPTNQTGANSGAETAGTTNPALNQNQAPGTTSGNAAIAPVQVQVAPGQSVLLQVVSPNGAATTGGTNLGVNQGDNGTSNAGNLNGTNAAGTNAVGNAGANPAARTTNSAASTTTINPGGVLDLSTATSDRPTGANVGNTGTVNNQTAVGNQNAVPAQGQVVPGQNLTLQNGTNNNAGAVNQANLNNAANQNNQALAVRGTLDAELQRAVCAQNWQQATGIVNRAIAASPSGATQYRAQLEAYRNQLQTLQAANTRVPNWQQQCGG